MRIDSEASARRPRLDEVADLDLIVHEIREQALPADAQPIDAVRRCYGQCVGALGGCRTRLQRGAYRQVLAGLEQAETTAIGRLQPERFHHGRFVVDARDPERPPLLTQPFRLHPRIGLFPRAGQSRIHRCLPGITAQCQCTTAQHPAFDIEVPKPFGTLKESNGVRREIEYDPTSYLQHVAAAEIDEQ